MATGKGWLEKERAPRKGQEGFAYLVVMMLVASIGVFMAQVFDGWQDRSQKLKEKQLLFVGRQIRYAITQYYEHSPVRASRFPASLEDLLRDPRQPGTARYLREVYRDPMTGTRDWGLVKSASGEIVGVYSRALAQPLKQGNFPSAERGFQGARSYAEWVFSFTPGGYSASQSRSVEHSYNNK